MNTTKKLSWLRLSAFALCGATLFAGCGGGADEDPAVGEAPAATDTAAASAASGGSLAGKISFEGTPPEQAAIDMEGDPKCAAMHGDKPLIAEQVVVSENGGLANVFLYIKNAPEGDYPAPETPVVLDQIGCAYVPHVLGVQAGQPMEIRNSDGTTHNVRGIARKNKAMNYGQPVGSPPRTKTFKKAEMGIRLKCDLHPWMTGFVFAMDHPYFSVSDAEGNFSIAGLPAGEYDVVAWHEQYDEQTGTVTVAADGSGSIDFSFSD